MEAKDVCKLVVRNSPPGQPPEPLVGGEEAKRRYIGREQVNGHEADHWEITEPVPNGTPLVWQYWEDIRLHAALKQEIPGVSYYELTNIREGKQPAELFNLPEDYREVPPPENHQQ